MLRDWSKKDSEGEGRKAAQNQSCKPSPDQIPKDQAGEAPNVDLHENLCNRHTRGELSGENRVEGSRLARPGLARSEHATQRCPILEATP